MLHIYNTLTRSVEEFKPLRQGIVTIYSCGPTVYDYQHIGHMRRYMGDDILIRVLKLNVFSIKHIQNITDVGHLVSDSDEGEDKMEKGSRKFGKSVWDIAKMFEKQFTDSCKALNITPPDLVMHATDFIPEQIILIKALEQKGYTYKIEDGIYFDTSKFKNYFQLSLQNPEKLISGSRVELIKGKKNITDFALWKFSPTSSSGKIREMEWDSPWGRGFPGWHIECSAMSLQGLFKVFEKGNLKIKKVQTIDIHTGGIDHINIHHTNEIAQSEAATDKKFVNYWIHHNFLLVNGEKMSKSLNNFYTVQDIIDKGFDPLSLRYLYLQTHYRQEMNFTWESLEAAQTALARLRSEATENQRLTTKNQLPIGCAEFERRFLSAINNDLNMSEALSIVWELLKSNYPSSAKVASLKKFDEVLGLDLFKNNNKIEMVGKSTIATLARLEKASPELKQLVSERETARKKKDYDKADELRLKIEKLGFVVEDKKEGTQVKKPSLKPNI